MANSKIFNTASVGSVVNSGFNSTYNNLIKTKNRSVHKSLDFSNVGIPTGESSSNKNLRQFHQTRLYIQDFGGMYHHTDMSGSSSNTYLISANLPESFSYKIGSRWEAPLSAFGDAKFNALMQTLGNSLTNELPSGINRATTLKIWGGTEPLSFSLRIPVIDDGYQSEENATGVSTNLAEALEFLGSLCLPRLETYTGFYTPPPSPLNISIKLYDKAKSLNFHPTYGRIMLQLGGILLVDRCLIESIHVEYPNTKALIRHTYANEKVGETASGNTYLTPLLAYVTIGITTVEAITSDTYSHMLWLKQQSNMGSGNIHVWNGIKQAADTGLTIGSNMVNMISDFVGINGNSGSTRPI